MSNEKKAPGSYSVEEIEELRAIHSNLRELYQESARIEKQERGACSSWEGSGATAQQRIAVAICAQEFFRYTQLLKDIETEQARTAQPRRLPRREM